MPKNLRLTELAIRRATVPDTYRDTELKAFGLRVGRRTKTFFVIKDGGRRIKIGHFPDWSLKEARREAWLLLDNRREERPTGTFEDAFKDYYRLRVQLNYRFRCQTAALEREPCLGNHAPISDHLYVTDVDGVLLAMPSAPSTYKPPRSFSAT